MREHVYALGLSAQDVNVKRCTHFAPTLWSEDIQYSLHNYLSRKKHDNKIYTSKKSCLLYTSDAADDMQCVDLGGRRIIKKKTTKPAQR